MAVPVLQAALVVVAVLVIELELVAAPWVGVVRVGVAPAVAPVLAFVVVENWRSELPSVAAWSQAALQ